MIDLETQIMIGGLLKYFLRQVGVETPFEHVSDRWKWLLDSIHGYPTCGAYCLFTAPDEPVLRDQVDDVWQRNISAKISLFAWSIIPSTECACAAGCGNLETAHHIFLDCAIAASVWTLVRSWLGIFSVAPNVIQQHFIQFSPMAGMTRSSHLFFKTVWLACVWVFWKEINHRIFKNIASDPSVLINKVKFHSFLWLKSHQVSFTYSYYDWWKHPLLCMGVHM
ncbi:hypothetical protein MTR_5g014380 [Medicago truncatula]|uniref:Reverse transcriptase zinc-binding domain-containing protein n=1 Tax=Medicago truncatula TaxID=3880 RepID=G7JZY3_MEDTR|nr:hypothetical protein MTR_5g014380 [Medicago truncatula]